MWQKWSPDICSVPKFWICMSFTQVSPHRSYRPTTRFLTSTAFHSPEFSPVFCWGSGIVSLALPSPCSLPSTFLPFSMFTLSHWASCGLDALHGLLPRMSAFFPTEASHCMGAAVSRSSLSLEYALVFFHHLQKPSFSYMIKWAPIQIPAPSIGSGSLL